MLENLQSEQLNFTVEDILLKRDMDFINKVKLPITYYAFNDNGICIDTNVRYSEYLPIKEVMQHFYRLNEYYEVNFYKGTFYKETEKLDIGPLPITKK